MICPNRGLFRYALSFFILGISYRILGIFVLGPPEAGVERRNSETFPRLNFFPLKHQCARSYQV